MIILNSWPDAQTITCVGCGVKYQLQPGDAPCTVLNGTITASCKCSICGAAMTLSLTKAQVMTLAIPVKLQSDAVKALLAGKNYTPPAPPNIIM